MRPTTTLLCLPVLSFFLSGCPEDDANLPWSWECDELASKDVSLVPGTGETTFEAVADGQALSPASGSQGGMHVWGSLQASWLHPGNVEYDMRVSTDEGYFARSGGQTQLTRTGGEGSELVGRPMFLELLYSETPSLFSEDPTEIEDWEERVTIVSAAWESLAGMDVVLRVEATDQCDATAFAERTVQVDVGGLGGQLADF